MLLAETADADPRLEPALLRLRVLDHFCHLELPSWKKGKLVKYK